MSSSNQKEVGDHVKIIAGANKEKEGILQEKVSNGQNIKLQTGEVVLAAFPFIKLLAKVGKSEESPQSEEPLESEALLEAEPENSYVEVIAEQTNENTSPAPEETGEETVDASEVAAQNPSNAPTVKGADKEIDIPEDSEKMTTVRLRDLAKEKGVSVARTKEDFLWIIKEKNPQEDLERLKGKVLFDRVSELHISRLRSKEDLQRLLAQK